MPRQNTFVELYLEFLSDLSPPYPLTRNEFLKTVCRVRLRKASWQGLSSSGSDDTLPTYNGAHLRDKPLSHVFLCATMLGIGQPAVPLS
jgi:hypothetical protein